MDLTKRNIDWDNWALSTHKTSKTYLNNIPILYFKGKIFLDANLPLFSDFATQNLPFSLGTKSDKYKSSTTGSVFVASSLNEIEVIKSMYFLEICSLPNFIVFTEGDPTLKECWWCR